MSLALADPSTFLAVPAAPPAAPMSTTPAGASAPRVDTGGTLGSIADWLVSLMETLGAVGAGIAVFAENLFPPIPSEVILPLAGFAASRGELDLVAAIVFTTLGSLAGALVLYGLGAWLGRDRMRAIARRLPLVDVDDVDKTEAWFQRHGKKAVFFGRMLPLFRSLISIPAGIERMNLLAFTLLTAAGSLIWNTVFILAGFALGEQWHVVEEYAGILQWVVIVGVAAAVVWFVVSRIRKRRARGGQSG